MGLVFVPVYVRYLGVESYGLIGIFAILQAWLSLLDMGMRPALSREMARYTAGAESAQSIRELLRSVEVVCFVLATLLAVGVWAASGWLASDWLKSKTIPTSVVASAFVVMGVVTALRFIENIYVSSVVGLQRQVLDNVLSSTMATARAVGAVAVLRWISPTIQAFFLWQGLISIATVCSYAIAVYRILDPSPIDTRFSKAALLGIWRYASGMMLITFLTLLLTQVDKMLLSRLLPLQIFSYYVLAGIVANVLYVLINPISAAWFPRLTELVTQQSAASLRSAYHQGAQLATVIVGAAAAVLIMFADQVLSLWTADPVLTKNVELLLRVLSLGTLFNALMWIPYQMQLAHGWTTLTVKVNFVAVSLLVPAIFFVVPRFGAVGAAWVWVILNAGYLVLAIHFMHKKLLATEKWRWYWQDVALPLSAALLVAGLLRWLLPEYIGRLKELAALAAVGVCVLAAAAFAAPMVRRIIVRYLTERMRSLSAPS